MLDKKEYEKYITEDGIVLYSGSNYMLNLLDLDETTLDISKYTTEIMIGIFGSGVTFNNYGYNPYFKVGDASRYEKCTKIARLSIFEPAYQTHSDRGKSPWKLEKGDIDLLMNIFTTKRHGDREIWDELTFICATYAAQDKRITDEHLDKIYNAPLPNYYALIDPNITGKQPGSKKRYK